MGGRGVRVESARVHPRGRLQLSRAEEALDAPKEASHREEDAVAARAAAKAARRRLVALRADGTIGDAAFQRIEEELDWAELDGAQFLRAVEGED